MITAAMSDPAIEPSTTLIPANSAAAAPAKDSSEMPCTAKGRSRIITNVLISPHTMPRITPAISELWTRVSRSP